MKDDSFLKDKAARSKFSFDRAVGRGVTNAAKLGMAKEGVDVHADLPDPAPR